VKGANLGKLLKSASVHVMGTYMKRALLASFAAFLLSSCSPSDQQRANEKAREAGHEMQREAAQASDQLKHGVEELDRKAGPKLDQAGREIRDETNRATEKIKRRADQIQGSDEPERK
jgi:hypothetical protein